MRKSVLSRSSGSFLAALQAHFDQGQQAGLGAAEAIGREAVGTGLETLDLARIHHHALAQLLTTTRRTGNRANLTACAAAFFAVTITRKRTSPPATPILGQEIADTQRLIEASTHVISRLAHEFSSQHER